MNKNKMEIDYERIEALAEEYIEKYDDRFKKVAKKAYMDGVVQVLKGYMED